MTPATAPSVVRDRFLAGLAAGLPPGIWSTPLVVGVSGGADSTALAIGLVALAPPGSRLVVAHAEHDLRAAAVDDRDFVAALAARLGLGFATARLAIRAPATGGEGLEGRARRLRYAFLEEVARGHAARNVLVAHTADDQAETILHRILRGTGPAGVAGMAAARELGHGVGLLRPLLGVTRADVRSFLAAAAEAWREDESNTDPRHSRNFLRHDVLARCTAGPYPAAASAVVRLGGQVGRLAAALRSAAERLLDVHARRHADGTVVLQRQSLAGLDAHLVRELFATLWEREGWPRRDMTTAHYARLAGLAGGEAAGPADYPGRVQVTVAAGWIELRPPYDRSSTRR